MPDKYYSRLLNANDEQPMAVVRVKDPGILDRKKEEWVNFDGVPIRGIRRQLEVHPTAYIEITEETFIKSKIGGRYV